MSYTKRLIDANALMDDVEMDGALYACLGAVDDVRTIVDSQPTVDAVEVVHGRWDDSFDGITPYCTACGRSHDCMNRTPNFCPNCGAKMDGGNEDA